MLRAGFPALPAEAPEAGRKTLGWVGTGGNQGASACEVCWVVLAGFSWKDATHHVQPYGLAFP